MKKSYEERQKECGLKVGDWVKVIRDIKDGEDGWTWGNRVHPTNLVGKEVLIVNIAKDYISAFSENFMDTFTFPYFVLEKVNEEPKQEQKETPKEGFSKLTFHFTNGEVLSFVGVPDDDEIGMFYDENGACYAIALEQLNYLKEEKI